MRKKILAVLMAATLALSLMACGSDESSDSDNDVSVENNSSTTDNSNNSENTKDDGIIDFEGGTFKVTYTKHEVSKDYEGNPCLLFYFNYTNNGEESSSSMVDSYIQCFQNGIECEIAILAEENEGIENSMKNIQPGVTLEVCNAYVLTDMSEVTLEASDWVSFSDDKDVQKITIE